MVFCLAALLVVGMLLFPHMPQYSVCNRKIDWGSILSGFIGGKLSADIEMHLAVFNPNRVDVRLRSATGHLFHHNELIGNMRISPVNLAGGSVSDLFALCTLEPGASRAVTMAQEHQQGKLLLDLKLRLETDLVLAANSRFRVNSLNTTVEMSDISPSQPENRQFCKCK